jgi:glutamine synthetase
VALVHGGADGAVERREEARPPGAALELAIGDEERLGGKRDKLNKALQELLTEIIKEHGAIIFNGDGYSESWHKEAAKRGLLNLATTPDALPYLVKADTKKLFEKYGVLSARELESRYEIYTEQYVKTVMTEAKLTLEIARTMVFPSAVRFQNELASTCANLKLVGYEFDTNTLDQITGLVKELQDSCASLKELLSHPHPEDKLKAAKHCRDDLLPAMLDVRQAADELEGFVADDLWPLPTYQEMLFIK